MDSSGGAAASSSSSSGDHKPSPRRELQGPRPSPLKVNKDSHKIAKKPPLFPHQYPPQQQQQQQSLLQKQNQSLHHRSPVIIYAVSPKVIHTTPSDFMSLVQSLTGNSSQYSSSSSSSSSAAAAAAAAAGGGAETTVVLSPAARLAAVERSTFGAAASPRAQLYHRPQLQQDAFAVGLVGEDADVDVELLTGRTGTAAISSAPFFPGILSPGPSSLQPISPSLFLASPSLGFDPTVLGYLSDLSPVLNGTTTSAVMLMSPGTNLLSTPTIPSPGAFWDLLNQFPD